MRNSSLVKKVNVGFTQPQETTDGGGLAVTDPTKPRIKDGLKAKVSYLYHTRARIKV